MGRIISVLQLQILEEKPHFLLPSNLSVLHSPQLVFSSHIQVSLAIEPPTAQLPSLHSGEYGCIFSNKESDYNFTTHFSRNKCLLAEVVIPSFKGTKIGE